MKLKKFFILFLTSIILFSDISFALEIDDIENIKYPDYSELYIGKDKLEKFNRKIFNFNTKLNNCIIKPIHILWASIMPQYGMDRIYGITKNIEYPIRLVSTLIQRDFKSAGTETVRFLTNSTIGLGGMFNPAEKLFKISAVDENMEQALAKCKVKQGLYMVIPVMASTTPRNMCGKLLDSIFNPSSYVGTPLIAAIKAVIFVNKTYYMQPLVKMIESNFADCYDITKKLYGLENYIKCSNFDRLHLVKKWCEDCKNNKNKLAENHNKNNLTNVSNKNDKKSKKIETENINEANILKGNATETDIILKNRAGEDDGIELKPDIILSNYNPQTPIIDSMRTALFEINDNYKSIWADFSIWNRAFYKRLKTASINVYPDCPNYKYRYLLQKKNSPVAIIYPSIGDGIMSTHASKFAKIFYDKGYSVVILSSHFNWEFAKSMPKEYYPGNPSVDVEYVKKTTDKIINSLEEKNNLKFSSKTVIGTSFGALMTMYVAEKENSETINNKNKYIAICPPVELVYAMNQVDKISENWKENPDTIKDDIAITAEKIIEISNLDELKKMNISKLPFSEQEAKLITGFILHQKLSDLIYAKNNKSINNTDLYKIISQTNYNNYVKEKLINDECKTIEDLGKNSNLNKLSTYLINANNYKIYHSVDDYLTNKKQLKQLKLYTGTKSVYYSNGAHLGFIYRDEFLNDLKKEISIVN